MKRGVVFLFVLVGMGCFAGQAFATPPPPPTTTGYIEICKAAQSVPILGSVSGPFNFTVTDAGGHAHAVTVNVGSCSGDIQVQSGTATVVETAVPWAVVTAITGLPGQNAVGTPNLATGTVSVNVPASADTTGAVTVNYTNAFDPGVIEVCKSAYSGSGLTGTYNYTITGSDNFTTTTSVTITPTITSSCSLPITVPAGSVTVQEVPSPVYVTSITATGPGGSNELTSSDLGTGTAVIGVNAGDATEQTIVTFTNDVSTLKLCKVGDRTAPGLTFPFTITTSGPAGPTAPTNPNPVLSAGTAANPVCTVVGVFRAGTVASIAEGIVPGTKVESIAVTPPGSVSTPVDLGAGTVSVTLGAGQTLVTYTDEPADPGPMKICKLAGSPAPVGTSFSFTVTSNVAGIAPQTVVVPVGQCEQVGGPSFTYPFHSTETVTEAPSMGNAVSAIGTTPAAALISSNLGAGTAQVMITQEDLLTEVTYTDVDPPNIVIAPPANSAGGGGGGSSASMGGGGSTAPSTSVVPAIVPTVGAGAGLTVGTGSTGSAGTKAKLANALKLSKLQSELKALKLQLVKLTAKEHAAKTVTAKLAVAKQISSLKKSEAKLSLQIKQLKH
jgi:hypothetical protein